MRFPLIVASTSGVLEASAGLARMMGQGAIILLIGQVALALRFVAARVTSDVLAMNRLHQRLGQFGAVLVLAHPLLLLAGSPEPARVFLTPRFSDSTELVVSLGKIALVMLAAV